ncbi:MAG: gliding motility-associated C-terminal domain-containing protein [Flavobacteriales bacterium]|nr:gliding motility-associated C-terminal domain-containing protein [Flavobacteriales bacterium]MCL4857187.1 gliding motility-associated C-terminal domain-containing protein [Flavobacteriales bacterium]
MLNTFKNIKDIQSRLTSGYKPLYILFLSLIISVGSSKAQNLVYNGDFEIYDTCPTNFSQPLDYQIEHASGWYMPTAGTSDYFNECNTTTVNVPNNLLGYQTAYSGQGYVGFYSNQYFMTQLQCPNLEWVSYGREYVQTKLVSPLLENTVYRFSFYISLADTVGGYAVKNIGALFTNDSIGFDCFKPIIANPQIKSPDFVTDNINWTKVEGEFIAQGGEQYLTIGNFADTLNFATDTLCVKSGTDWQDGSGIAYYYVDGIILELIENIDSIDSTQLIIPNVFTPNGDNKNDLFILNFSYEKVEIFNRWGNKMFESINNDSFWNGKTTSGVDVSDGTYYYLITTKEKTYKGFIQLLR